MGHFSLAKRVLFREHAAGVDQSYRSFTVISMIFEANEIQQFSADLYRFSSF